MTRNIFDEKISVWSNTTRSDANRCVVTIKQFLDAGSYYLSTPNMPTDIQRLRLLYDTAMQTYPTDPARAASLFEQYKQNKKYMPLATMGGTFANGGLKEDMLTASKVLCLDIDSVKPTDHWKYEGKTIPNAHIKDWNRLKWELAKLPFVAYASLSIGDHGLFLLIPIADENRHSDYWLTLQHLFQKNLNLTIDPNTKDITRPRFISYDPQPYVNDQAEVFDKILPQQRPTISVRNYTAPATSTEDAVRKCVEEIERRSLDITSLYDEWIDIASALYNGLGEAGKEYFMRLSAFYPNSNQKEIEYKWQKNKSRSQVGIGTFFDICSRYGIRYKDSSLFRPTPVPSPPKPALQPAPAEATTTAKIIPIPLFPQPYSSIWEDMPQQEFDEIFGYDEVQRAMSAPVPF